MQVCCLGRRQTWLGFTNDVDDETILHLTEYDWHDGSRNVLQTATQRCTSCELDDKHTPLNLSPEDRGCVGTSGHNSEQSSGETVCPRASCKQDELTSLVQRLAQQVKRGTTTSPQKHQCPHCWLLGTSPERLERPEGHPGQCEQRPSWSVRAESHDKNLIGQHSRRIYENL